MPADTTDISKMALPSGNVNTPASGTYGEGAALERLKAQLPGTASVGGPTPSDPTAPMPTPPIGPMGSPPAGGLPPALLAPTQRPDVPVSTPLQDPMAMGMPAPQTGRQRNLAILDALANNPDVSETTREFARLMMDRLIGSSRA